MLDDTLYFIILLFQSLTKCLQTLWTFYPHFSLQVRNIFIYSYSIKNQSIFIFAILSFKLFLTFYLVLVCNHILCQPESDFVLELCIAFPLTVGQYFLKTWDMYSRVLPFNSLVSYYEVKPFRKSVFLCKSVVLV